MRAKSLFIARQSGFPQGWFGHIVALVMARETAAVNRMAIDHLNVEDGNAVLEVGFGHGQTVREIARRVRTATISGVDPSDVMMRVARRKCGAYTSRLDLRGGVAEFLPFDDGVFDRALSVHTTYFWPQLDPGLREIRRVLRDRGRFVLGFRPADDEIASANVPASVYTLHSIEDMKSALSRAGFNDVTIERAELSKGFIAWAICS
jgi:SAM-dependent methyltransferase